jgi:hypothetical protein
MAMAAPVTDTLLSRLADCLHECSEELGNDIDARYGDTLRYPIQRRRYARDMKPVERARALLAEVENRARTVIDTGSR